ncbi:hypothetical protein LCGC14_2269250, partial [marine sediment metagenome]
HEVYRNAEIAKAADPFTVAIDHLNEKYQQIPDNKTSEEWATERIILAASFTGYLWYYQNEEQVETLGTEISFELPLIHPKIGMSLPLDEVKILGKIDRLVRRQGTVQVRDYKSTGKSIAADSSFWGHLRLDTQISMYVMAATILYPELQIAGAFYDVWHKPTIKPKALTQKDTKALVETGKYCGTEFTVWVEADDTAENGVRWVKVDDRVAEIEHGKKGYAIRETPELYGARLLQDIYKRPEFYFARREIPRTAQDIKKFEKQLYNIYQSMKSMRDSGHWFENEHACEATFKCPYIPLCYPDVDITGGQTPPGYKRIFMDMTVGETD